jgi:hypothetical protein
LKSLKEAQDEGATILKLQGLHAKILLTDEVKLSLGSQNLSTL